MAFKHLHGHMHRVKAHDPVLFGGVCGGRGLNVEGVGFTDASEEELATALRDAVRMAGCPACGWGGYTVDAEGAWRTTCPEECRVDGRATVLRPLLHIPYDPDLFAELNVERYDLGKTGKTLFSYPAGTHDDRFWALALAVLASDVASSPASKPIAVKV